jgi:hypothetical protein
MARIIHFLTAGTLTLCGTMVEAQTPNQTGSPANGSSAQTSGRAGATAQTNQAEASSSLAAGTALNAELSKTVDTRKAKPGDSVSAQTTEAVKADGKVVIPKGTKLEGHITRASARVKGDADSALAMQFDRAVFKDGRTVPMQVTIQALASDQRVAAVNGDELQPAGNIEGGAAGAGTAGNRGVVGGVGSTVGGATSGAASTVPRTVRDQSGAVNSTLNGAASTATRAEAGLSASGELLPTSRGVFGLSGLTLNANAANSTEGAVITSAGKNVHLDSGTKILLVTQAATSVSAQR